MNETRRRETDLEAMEAAIASQGGRTQYSLRLYIAGNTAASTRAVVNIRKICESHLNGFYELEVVDLLQNPALAIKDQIIATPTLIRLEPPPMRRFIGDLSEGDRVLSKLGLTAPGATNGTAPTNEDPQS